MNFLQAHLPLVCDLEDTERKKSDLKKWADLFVAPGLEQFEAESKAAHKLTTLIDTIVRNLEDLVYTSNLKVVGPSFDSLVQRKASR